ncbi:MAG: ribonuclease P protein component [Eubacteriales bacterium]|nr:ribonuclease P protein component [Eubacteriales bacterium]
MKSRYTIKKNSDFRRIYAKGKSAVSPYLVVYCRKNKGTDIRTGFTVSAKIGNAVTRNTVRRRLRDIFRRNSKNICPGLDIIIVARSKAVHADFSTLSSCFSECCSRLNILNNPESLE